MNCVQICVHSRSNRPPKVKSFYTPSLYARRTILGRRLFFFKFILLFSSASRLTNNTGVSTSCEWWVERGGVGTTLFMCSPKEEDKEVHPERTKKGHYEWNARLVWNERRKRKKHCCVCFISQCSTLYTYVVDHRWCGRSSADGRPLETQLWMIRALFTLCGPSI
jgi:hypothetical protein